MSKQELYLLTGQWESWNEKRGQTWKTYTFLAVATDPKEALEIVEQEKTERFGIRKTTVKDLKVVGVLRKPALLFWSEFGPAELDESDFAKIDIPKPTKEEEK